MPGETPRNTTAATLASLQTELHGHGEQLAKLDATTTRMTGQMARVDTTLAAFSARADALIERVANDTRTLFELHEKLANSVHEMREGHIDESEIRQRFDFHEVKIRNVEDGMRLLISNLSEKIETINGRVNRILGVGAALVFVLEVGRILVAVIKG